jgi:hypothetical protein
MLTHHIVSTNKTPLHQYKGKSRMDPSLVAVEKKKKIKISIQNFQEKQAQTHLGTMLIRPIRIHTRLGRPLRIQITALQLLRQQPWIVPRLRLFGVQIIRAIDVIEFDGH